MSLAPVYTIAAAAIAEGCLVECLGKYLKKASVDSPARQFIALGRFCQNFVAASFIASSILEQRKKIGGGLCLVGMGLLFTSWIPVKAWIEDAYGDKEKAKEYEKTAYIISLVVKVANVGMLLKLALEGSSYEKPILAGVIVLTFLSMKGIS